MIPKGRRGDLNRKEILIICGIALGRALHSQPSLIFGLRSVWQRPKPSEIARLSRDLVSSEDVAAHEIGFILQAIKQNELPEPDPIQWRDFALELCERQIRLVDLMYRVRELHEMEKYPARKQALQRSAETLQDWQGCVGEAVLAMRVSNWIKAKTYLDASNFVSHSRDLDALVKDYPNFGEAIKSHRDEAFAFSSKVMEYPSKTRIPKERIPTILQVQSMYLRLLLLRNSTDKDNRVSSITNYPIEKLGVAIDFLLSPNTDIETANYEIGLATSHMQWKAGEIPLSPVGKQLRKISKELENTFSTLPARPWPMKGFGSPGVESRFKGEKGI